MHDRAQRTTRRAGSRRAGRFVKNTAALALLLAGCTSIGTHDPRVRSTVDFGPPDAVSLCLYLDDGVSEERARGLVEEAWSTEAPLYGLRVKVTGVTRWHRPAFTMDGILEALSREPLRPGCDRVLALLGRHVGDFIWGLLPLPEALGAVDDDTLTHAYAVITRVTINQIFLSPRNVVRHELYHMLGCPEHFDMEGCYRQIAALKRWKLAHQSEFFPAWDSVKQEMLVSRESVNARLNSSGP